MATASHETHLDFQLSTAQKQCIEQAAAQRGQSVGDFALSTLLRISQRILQDEDITELSHRDHQRVMALLDEPARELNPALAKAAMEHSQRVRR